MTNLLTTLVKATGFTLAQEVELWYALWHSLWVICDQLDDDSGVTLTTYEANCFTAMLNASIEDSQGNVVKNLADARTFRIIRPTGITEEARWRLMYDFTNAWETLCEQLDGDSPADADYEALCYTALFLHIVKDPDGVTDLGNGTVYYFGKTADNRKQLIEWFYNAFNALETLTEKLDADGTVNDTDYEANAYTATCLIQIENGAGSVIGN